MEAILNSGLLLLGESITLVMSNWSFDMLGDFSWNEILACVVKYGKIFAKVFLLLSILFASVYLCG